MDLPLTQVKQREIGVFVDNLKRLLIKNDLKGLAIRQQTGYTLATQPDAVKMIRQKKQTGRSRLSLGIH